MSRTLPGIGVLSVGDHAYFSPPFDARSGEPYMVGRVQEFVPGDKARVAFFLRPRDIGSRTAIHGRRLLATMHSDVVPLSFIRGKCQVLHRDRIPNKGEEAYRRQPDCFYYHQLYDRYLHRYFDVIETSRVRNAPANVLEFLNDHFEFVVCEAGFVHDLCSELKACITCSKWTTATDSIMCEMCGSYFHLGCLDPPLTKRPGLGFVFTCAPCAHRREEEYEKYYNGERTSPPPAPLSARMARKGKGKARAPPKPASSAISTSMKTTNGWPYRYFGYNIDPTDILNPHESLYPRAATKVGPRHQTVVADQLNGPVGSTSKLKSQAIQRGTDSAVELLYSSHNADPEDDRLLDAYLERIKTLPLYKQTGVRLLDRALQLWRNSRHTAFSKASRLTLTDLKVASWSDVEMKEMDQALKDFQDDLEEVKTKFPRKSMADVVNYVYIHRPDVDLHSAENPAEDKYAAIVPTGMSAVLDDSAPEADVEAIEERSLAGTPPPKGCACTICDVKESESWYRCPPSLGSHWSQGKVLCKECSIQWRHYGNASGPVVDDPDKKRKKAKEEEDPTAAAPAPCEPTPPPAPIVIPPKPCLLCRQMEPTATLAQCQNCTMSGHATCYGIPSDTDFADWYCELCDAARRPPSKSRPTWHTFDMDPARRLLKPLMPEDMTCVLCPEMDVPDVPKEEETLSAVDIIKITDNSSYIHLLCAMWHPELILGNQTTYQNIEGIQLIPRARRSVQCRVCKLRDVGACVGCAECHHSFHVACAWADDYRFGLVMDTSKQSTGTKKKPIVPPPVVTFKGTTGVMVAKIWCKSHRPDPAVVTYELDERDPATDMTALQTYITTYKAPTPDEDSYPLLRRARLVDAFVQPISKTIAEAEKEAIKEAKEKERLAKIAKAERVKKQQAKRKATAAAKRKRREEAEEHDPQPGASRSSSSQPAGNVDSLSVADASGPDLTLDPSYSYDTTLDDGSLLSNNTFSFMQHSPPFSTSHTLHPDPPAPSTTSASMIDSSIHPDYGLYTPQYQPLFLENDLEKPIPGSQKETQSSPEESRKRKPTRFADGQLVDLHDAGPPRPRKKSRKNSEKTTSPGVQTSDEPPSSGPREPSDGVPDLTNGHGSSAESNNESTPKSERMEDPTP